MTVPGEEAPANPRASSRGNTKGLALFRITGRKGRVGGRQSDVKVLELNLGLHLILAIGLNSERVWNSQCGGEIRRCGKNTGGEGGYLDTDAEARKRGEQTGLDTPRRKR